MNTVRTSKAIEEGNIIFNRCNKVAFSTYSLKHSYFPAEPAPFCLRTKEEQVAGWGKG